MQIIDSLQEIQSIENGILQHFAIFCQQNYLRYFLAYGTLLGAIRHKGFIPWDDDIDILMPRDDYNRFWELTKQKKIFDYINVHDPLNDDKSWSIVLRVYDERTSIVKPYMGHGIYIDIHPLDIYPNNKMERVIWLFRKKILNIILICADMPYKSFTKWKSLIKSLTLWPFKLYGFTNARNNIIKNAYRYQNFKSEYVGCFVTDYPLDQKVIPKKMFEQGKQVTFENFEYNVPYDTDGLLRIWYGDYMKLPELNERRPKHPIEAMWL